MVFRGEDETIQQFGVEYRMRLVGAEVIPVKTGTGLWKRRRFLSCARMELSHRCTHYCLASVMEHHWFPTMVRDFQAVISKEIKEQMIIKEGKVFIYRSQPWSH